jgi:hypothetical protein
MLHTVKYRIAAITSAIVMSLGFALTFGSSTALAAGSGSQFCTGLANRSCLNQWNGGSNVNVYSRGVVNNDFTLNYEGNGNYSLSNSNGGHSDGLCIGDYGNSSSNATAGLDQCPSPGNGGGWGTNFHVSNCTAIDGGPGFEFKNNHWPNGWLGPQSDTNGAHFYLNKPTSYCFEIFPPA